MNFSKFNKILIIRFSSLGDVLLTTPLIRTLKSLYPHLEIDFLVREEFKSTLSNNPHINKLILLKRDYINKQIRNEIIKDNYNLIIDLQNNLRSRRLTKNISKNIVRYKKPYLNRILLVKLKINKFKEIIPIPVRYANSIPGFKLDDKGLELYTSSNNSILLKGDNYIGLCPGSKHVTKMWPKEYFVELGNELIKLNFKIVLFGGRDDIEICKEISSKIDGSVNLANDNNLLELAANMKLCKVVICNDSGLMHTALAVNLPIVSIFGSTVKEFGFFPYKGKSKVLENNSLTCRPCSHIGLDECPKGHLNCMKSIKPALVLEQTLELIK